MTAGTIEITDKGKAAIRDWEAEHKARTERQDAVLTRNKAVLFPVLRKAGTKTVIAKYDGRGDSGAIEHVSASTARAPPTLPKRKSTSRI